MRSFIDGDAIIDLKDEDQQVLEDPVTSALEKKRRRIINDFYQQIKKQ